MVPCTSRGRSAFITFKKGFIAMTGITANDTLSLDEDFDVNPTKLDEDATKKNMYLAEILSNPARLEIIYKCEACADDLRSPMFIATTTSDDEPRDASILCADCTP